MRAYIIRCKLKKAIPIHEHRKWHELIDKALGLNVWGNPKYGHTTISSIPDRNTTEIEICFYMEEKRNPHLPHIMFKVHPLIKSFRFDEIKEKLKSLGLEIESEEITILP